MTEFGAQLPRLEVPPPGPASRALSRRLALVESRNVTYLGDSLPTFWTEARGANVRDADGNVYLDLTGAFGVALTGHADPAVRAALARQSDRLVHGMGDVHPPAGKVELLEMLADLLPWSGARAVLGSSGSEAVEAALKTAQLRTGRPGILAFEGAYHGLTLGALAGTGRRYFREPFAGRVYEGVARVPFPRAGGGGPEEPGAVLEAVERAFRKGAPNGDAIGAVLIEPVQARGGVRVLPEAFGRALTALAVQHGAVLIADEIFTGLGRCGSVLASGRVGLEPGLVCLGKALGGGLPLSACVGPSEVMDAWPLSTGEALHTSTFLGHPLACAAACAVLEQVGAGLPERVEALGARLSEALRVELVGAGREGRVRGLGLLIGVDAVDAASRPVAGGAASVAASALTRGLLVLPAGDAGEVVQISPPVCLTGEQERWGLEALVGLLRIPVAGPR